MLQQIVTQVDFEKLIELQLVMYGGREFQTFDPQNERLALNKSMPGRGDNNLGLLVSISFKYEGAWP